MKLIEIVNLIKSNSKIIVDLKGEVSGKPFVLEGVRLNSYLVLSYLNFEIVEVDEFNGTLQIELRAT